MESSNNHKSAFQILGPIYKFIINIGLFFQSYFLWASISHSLAKDNQRTEPLDRTSFGIRRGLSSFNGAGGFFWDIFGFLESTTQINNTFINPDKKRRWIMAFWTLAILLVAYPFISYVFKLLQNAAKEGDIYHYLYGEPIALVASSFLMTMMAVYFGLAMRYWVDQVLRRALTEKEWEDYRNPNKNSVTLKEIAIRLGIGLPLGLVGSMLVSHYKPLILEKLGNLVSKSSFVYRYTDIVLSTVIILLGLHCVTLRVLLPAIVKIVNKFCMDENHKNQPRKYRTLAVTILLYTSGVVLFGVSAWVDRMQYFADPMIQTLVFQGVLFGAILCNVIGSAYIFKMMMLIVNGRKLVDGLMSDDENKVNKTQRRVKINKGIGASCILIATAIVLATVGLFIYSKIENVTKISDIIESIYFIVPLITLFTCLVFAGIVLNGRTKYIDTQTKSGLLNDDLNDLFDKINREDKKRLFADIFSDKNFFENGDKVAERKENDVGDRKNGSVTEKGDKSVVERTIAEKIGIKVNPDDKPDVYFEIYSQRKENSIVSGF